MTDFIMYLMSIVDNMGYVGIFMSTALEYACFPVSSEILLPFIGCSVYNGSMELIPSVFVSVLGAVLGCSFCFFAGRIGKSFIENICRKHPCVKSSVVSAEERFEKHGDFSVFVFRLFPIARTYISFPAGMSKMKYSKFIYFSFAGAFIWNSILISSGYILGEYWSSVSVFMKSHKTVFNIIIFSVIALLILKSLKKH